MSKLIIGLGNEGIDIINKLKAINHNHDYFYYYAGEKTPLDDDVQFQFIENCTSYSEVKEKNLIISLSKAIKNFHIKCKDSQETILIVGNSSHSLVRLLLMTLVEKTVDILYSNQYYNINLGAYLMFDANSKTSAKTLLELSHRSNNFSRTIDMLYLFNATNNYNSDYYTSTISNHILYNSKEDYACEVVNGVSITEHPLKEHVEFLMNRFIDSFSFDKKVPSKEELLTFLMKVKLSENTITYWEKKINNGKSYLVYSPIDSIFNNPDSKIIQSIPQKIYVELKRIIVREGVNFAEMLFKDTIQYIHNIINNYEYNIKQKEKELSYIEEFDRYQYESFQYLDATSGEYKTVFYSEIIYDDINKINIEKDKYKSYVNVFKQVLLELEHVNKYFEITKDIFMMLEALKKKQEVHEYTQHYFSVPTEVLLVKYNQGFKLNKAINEYKKHILDNIIELQYGDEESILAYIKEYTKESQPIFRWFNYRLLSKAIDSYDDENYIEDLLVHIILPMMEQANIYSNNKSDKYTFIIPSNLLDIKRVIYEYLTKYTIEINEVNEENDIVIIGSSPLKITDIPKLYTKNKEEMQ